VKLTVASDATGSIFVMPCDRMLLASSRDSQLEHR